MNSEIWKTIDGYDGKYQISSHGRVKSLFRVNQYGTYYKEHFLKPSLHEQGYLYVILSKNNNSQKHYIHRLVANAFISNIEKLPEVNHINEIKNDNRVENLEWCTSKYNSNYGTKIDRHKKLISKPVIQETLDGDFVRRFNSATEAEKEIGYNATYISAVCHGKRKHAYGYKFYFENN